MPLGDERLAKEVAAAGFVLAADGGANVLAHLGLRCDAILGDFDSLSDGVLVGVPRIPAANQDLTDLAKAVEYLVEASASTIRIVCATGSRLDHTFCALGILAAYGRRVDLALVDDVAEARLVVSEMSLHGVLGRTISLLPVTPCVGVVTQGLRWDLHGDVLAAGVRESISNVADAHTVHVSVTSGDLIAYVHHAA